MSLKSAFLLAAATAFAVPAVAGSAAAQETRMPAIEAGHTLLTVTADGSSTRVPDMAVFNSGVTTQGATASAALAENSTKMSAVIAALKRAGIADKDIQTSNLSLSPVYAPPTRLPDGSYESSEQRIIGYQANNNVSVKQRKLGDYGKVIDALVNAGANQVNGPSFMLSQPDAAMDEARLEAVKTARQRAQLYAQASGLKVVRIVSISESGGYSPPQPMLYRAKEDSMAAAPPPVAAGELEMTVNVTMQFELAS